MLRDYCWDENGLRTTTVGDLRSRNYAEAPEWKTVVMKCQYVGRNRVGDQMVSRYDRIELLMKERSTGGTRVKRRK